jgi:hypothetical protein
MVIAAKTMTPVGWFTIGCLFVIMQATNALTHLSHLKGNGLKFAAILCSNFKLSIVIPLLRTTGLLVPVGLRDSQSKFHQNLKLF